MDRRGFFKTILATPLITPLLLASKTKKKELELYLIADHPELFISSLLEELEQYTAGYGRNFTFLNPHPQESEMEQILSQKGWRYVQKPLQADLALSFSHLWQKALPSFTLVREGRICDIRSRKLYSIWRKMNESHNPSACLTIASFKNRQIKSFAGESVSIFKEGRKTKTISLKEDTSKSFRTNSGTIAVKIKDGKAWISGSSCPHKICLYSPPVSLAGERIICAPNHFLLEVQGSHSVDTIIG